MIALKHNDVRAVVKTAVADLIDRYDEDLDSANAARTRLRDCGIESAAPGSWGESCAGGLHIQASQKT
jgi:hypothetical protein